MSKEVGIVLSRVKPMEVEILVFDEYLNSGDLLWNALVKIPYLDGFVVGVVVDYERVNPIMEDKELVKRLKHLLEKNQILQAMKERRELISAKVRLLTAFDRNMKRISINVPLTVGERVYRLTDKDFSIPDFKPYYLGRFYGENILQPLYIADFHELGEAFHFVVAGQTGAGKSTLVMLILILYAKASHERFMKTRKGKRMNFFVISPVPEFRKAFEGNQVGKFGLNLRDVFQSLGYSIEIYDHKTLAFDRWEVLQELLIQSNIFEILRIKKSEYKERATEIFIEELRKKTTLEKFGSFNIETINHIENILLSEDFARAIYKQEKNVQELMEDARKNFNAFREKLKSIAKLFNRQTRKAIGELVKDIANDMEGGKVIVVETSYGGNITIQRMVVREIVESLRQEGMRLYEKNPTINMNTLVVFDEAHNYAPKRTDEEYLQRLRDSIIKAYAETRKFGIGWMTISTRLSLLDKHIYQHARVKIIGYGLTTGEDADILREEFGKENLERYWSFADPSDPLSQNKEYSFLISGPITIISRKEPELLTVFSNAEEFLSFNQLGKKNNLKNYI
ncbi:MAG: hypothetical protein QXR80_06675 [Desulfurococcaceae archaeon]